MQRSINGKKVSGQIVGADSVAVVLLASGNSILLHEEGRNAANGISAISTPVSAAGTVPPTAARIPTPVMPEWLDPKEDSERP